MQNSQAERKGKLIFQLEKEKKDQFQLEKEKKDQFQLEKAKIGITVYVVYKLTPFATRTATPEY